MEAIEEGTLPPELLVCGAAGTGKTFGLIAIQHLIACEYPDLRILWCRQFRSSLTNSVLQTFEDEILPADSMEWIAGKGDRENRRSYRYPNGTRIVLGGIDKWERIKSTAWDIIFVNEATELRLEAWEGLGSRLNRPGRDPRFGWLIGDTNPADPMHPLKVRCDQGRTTLWDTTHEANPRLYDEDAEQWTEEGEFYLERLDRLTGSSYLRLRKGLWAAGEGAWFAAFDDSKDTSQSAEYKHGAGPVHLAIDCNGKHIAAVFFQIRNEFDDPHINIFADYYSEDPAADAARHARAILDLSRKWCSHQLKRTTGDPSGSQHTGVNTTVTAEYRKAGLPFVHWPKHPGSVLAGLQLVETFLGGRLTVHPRAEHMRTALLNFKRARRNDQWIDKPEDPQHPHEDLIEALRGGLLDRWPNGRTPGVRLGTIRAANLI